MKIELKPIDKQIIVITGASSGIGLVTARMAAKEGAKLVLAARNQDALQQLAQEITDKGGHAVYVVADVGNRVANKAITEFGGFTTWVNNAGVSIFGKCEDVSIPDMQRMFDTNFWGVVYGSRIAVKHYKQTGKHGAIINIGSFFGDRATPVQSTYSASKHALHGWTDALRMELEMDKAPISVTLIHPGRIDTPYNEHAHSYIPEQPAHRGYIYPPESVASAILYSAQHQQRDMYVGFQSKFLAVLGNFAPRLVDKIMEKYMYYSQRDDRPSRSREESGLYKPGYGLQERGTHPGYVNHGSMYVTAVKHPVATTIAVAGLTAFVLAAKRRKKAIYKL
jgi:short-subunit dehydrogenase